VKTERLAIVLCGLAIVLAVGVVSAQEEPAEPPPTAEEVAQEEQEAREAREPFMEEIVVTARKTAETLDSVPLTIRAFTAEDMKTLGVESMTNIAEQTPGLVISNYQGKRDDPGLLFRGMDVGTVGRTQQNSSSFVDGVYLPGSSLFLPMEDLERTEVVKGPQSAFYGRNVFGGAVNLITKSPPFDWRGDFSATVGSDSRQDYNVGIGGPITEKLAFHVFGRYYDYGGGWDNPTPDSEALGAESSTAGTASLAFQPSPSANFRLRVLYDQDDDGPGTNIFFPSSILNCGPFTQDGLTGTSQYYCGELATDLARPAGYDTTTEDVPGSNWPKNDFGLERDFMLATFTFDVGLGGNVFLDSNTSYLTEDTFNVDDFTGANQMLWWYHTDDTLFSQELRLNGSSSSFDWLIGAYYLDAEYEDLGSGFGCADENSLVFGFLPFCPVILGLPPVRGAFLVDQTPVKTIQNKALFGSLIWRLTDSFSLSAEGRFARETIDEGVAENLVDGTLVPLKDDFDSFSPRVIANWNVTDNAMLYGSVAQGNKSGAFNPDFVQSVGTDCQDAFSAQYGVSASVPEEKLINYEVGWKQNINRGRHRFNVAGYYMDWRDQQFRAFVNQVDTNCDGVVDENDEFQVDYTTNAGKSQVLGAELFYSGWFTNLFNLTFSYNYNKTEYKEFEDASYASVFGSRDASGKEMPRSPNDSATLGLLFRLPLFGSWEFFARGDAIYTGSSWAWAHNLAKTPTALRANLRTGLENDRWTFSVWVQNLTDDDTVMWNRRFTDFTTLSTGFWGALAKPREYGATIRFRFF
jgi:outer membrane receptor protein involved in Fe transport